MVGRGRQRERLAPKGRQAPLPQSLEPEVDDLAVRMKQIVARYRVLRAQGTLPGNVAQQIHAALSNIEQRLSAPALHDAAAEPPILDTVARILELMEDAAGGPSDVPHGAATHPSPDDPAPTVAPPEPPAAVAGAEVLPVPVNPSLMAAVEGIWGNRRWLADGDGAPQYDYVSRDGHGRIVLSFARDPDAADGVAALWEAVKGLSTETVDILLVMVSRLAELPNPRKDTAFMRLEEIAAARGVSVRDGSYGKLHDDFREQILSLADLRLSIQWKNLDDDDTINFARDRPAHLLTIVDYSRHRRGTTWRAFEFSCGPALACFMRPDDLRLIGHFSRRLLQLNPVAQGVTKRVGTFYSFVGTAAARTGMTITVTARALLQSIGVEPDWAHPGRTVDALVKAHVELHEVGVLARPTDWEPPARSRGFFERWLDEPRTISLAGLLAPSLDGAPEAPPLLTSESRLAAPASAAELQADPSRLRAFHQAHGISLRNLAAAVGVSPSTMTRYVQGKHPLPEATARKLLSLWRQRERAAMR